MPRPDPTRPLPRRRPRAGMAMVLVVMVVGMASVMTMALLSSAAMQAQVNGNSLRAAQADYLAESGLTLGMYYLNYPPKAPSLTSEGYWPGATGIQIDPVSDDSVDVTVTDQGDDVFLITAVARAGPPSDQITRTMTAEVYVHSEYVIDRAASFRNAFTVPDIMEVRGGARSDSTFNIASGGSVTGTIQSTGPNSLTGWQALPTYPFRAAPAVSDLTLYASLGQSPAGEPTKRYYRYNGGLYKADLLPLTVAGSLQAPNPATNPANVWWADRSTTFSNATVNGTVVIRGAGRNMTVLGDVVITPRDGMPGLIVNGNILFLGGLTSKQLRVNGLCWLGGNFGSTLGTAWGCDIDVRGALMMANNASTITSAIRGDFDARYEADNVRIPDLSTTDRTPQYVKIRRWGS